MSLENDRIVAAMLPTVKVKWKREVCTLNWQQQQGKEAFMRFFARRRVLVPDVQSCLIGTLDSYLAAALYLDEALPEIKKGRGKVGCLGVSGKPG